MQAEDERLEELRMEEARGLVEKISLLDCSRLTEVLTILEQDGEQVEQDKGWIHSQSINHLSSFTYIKYISI